MILQWCSKDLQSSTKTKSQSRAALLPSSSLLSQAPLFTPPASQSHPRARLAWGERCPSTHLVLRCCMPANCLPRLHGISAATIPDGDGKSTEPHTLRCRPRLPPSPSEENPSLPPRLRQHTQGTYTIKPFKPCLHLVSHMFSYRRDLLLQGQGRKAAFVPAHWVNS